MCLKNKRKSKFHNICVVTFKKVMIYNYNRLTIEAFQHVFLNSNSHNLLQSQLNSRFLSFFNQINSITASFKFFSLQNYIAHYQYLICGKNQHLKLQATDAMSILAEKGPHFCNILQIRVSGSYIPSAISFGTREIIIICQNENEFLIKIL